MAGVAERKPDASGAKASRTNGSQQNGRRHASRLIERPTLKVEPTARRANPDPSAPAVVPGGDLNFAPERVPPDDDGQRWPVFLGKIIWVESRADADDAAGGAE